MLLQTQTVTTIEYTHASKRVAFSVSVLRRFGIYAGMAEWTYAIVLGTIGVIYISLSLITRTKREVQIFLVHRGLV